MNSPFGKFDEDSLVSFNEAMSERFDFAGTGKPCGGSHISASKTCRVGPSSEAMEDDLQKARKRLREKKAAQRKADSDSLKGVSRKGTKQEMENLKSAKNKSISDRRAVREKEIKGLSKGQDVTAMVGGRGVHGKFESHSVDSKGRQEAVIKLQESGPGFKKGDEMRANADRGWGGLGAPKRVETNQAPMGLEAWKARYQK